jgi:hypothetical protein
LDLRFVGIVYLEQAGLGLSRGPAQPGNALLRHRMAEVYAVRLFTAPSWDRAYPVRHQDVSAVTAPRFNVQPDGLRPLRRARPAEENRRYQRGHPHPAIVPPRLQVIRKGGFLRLDGLLRVLRRAHLCALVMRRQPGCERGYTPVQFELPFSPGHHPIH